MDDEREIRALNERYFNALDRLDFTAVGECFTTDAVAVYLSGEWEMQGREAILDRLQALRGFECSIHTPGTMSVTLDGAVAAGEVFATATLLLLEDAAQRVMVRGLRYTDRYLQQDGAWRIAHRRQDPLFQFEAPAVPPAIPTPQDP
jgi:uncharacterized protein (TIGR02246 family)